MHNIIYDIIQAEWCKRGNDKAHNCYCHLRCTLFTRSQQLSFLSQIYIVPATLTAQKWGEQLLQMLFGDTCLQQQHLLSRYAVRSS